MTISVQEDPYVISQQPADPREPALGLQWSVILASVCHAVGQMSIVFSGKEGRLSNIMGLFFLLFTVICYIVSSVWVRRCWVNAELLNPGGLPFKLGWATAGWLTPVLNVWMRWRILLGLWRSSEVPGAPRLVHLWLGAVLISWLADVTANIPNVYSGGMLVSTAAALLHSFVFIVLARRITTRQVEALNIPLAHPSTADLTPSQP